MEHPKITGNEPYFPTPLAGGDNSVVSTYNTNATAFTGITIRQKFIMDYIVSVANDSEINHPTAAKDASNAFKSYLKIINEPQP